MMREIKVEDAVGHVLCHDMTQIIPGEFKGARFRKGHVVAPEDVPVLLSMGKRSVYVWEMAPGMVHENDAALQLCRLAEGAGCTHGEDIKEGKIELKAAHDGCFRVRSERLLEVNSVEQVMIATRHGNTAVRAGDKLAGMRVIPLVIEQAVLDEAAAAAGPDPLCEVVPYKLRSVGIVTTGSEVAAGLIEDKFTPVVERKLAAFGIECMAHGAARRRHRRCGGCDSARARAGRRPRRLHGRHERGPGRQHPGRHPACRRRDGDLRSAGASGCHALRGLLR